jgi:hypothetical protein
MEAPKIKSRETSKIPEAEGFGPNETTLDGIQLRQITDQEINAANDEPSPVAGSTLKFPTIVPDMVDTPSASEAVLTNNSPLVEDNYTPKVTYKNIPENPAEIKKILAGTNLDISPDSTVVSTIPTAEQADPTALSNDQLETIQQVFAAKRDQNLERVIPAIGPLGEPTEDGDIKGRIDTASILPPEKVTFPTDRTPAGEYLNSPKANWQAEGKGFAPESQAANSTFFSRIKKLFG